MGRAAPLRPLEAGGRVSALLGEVAALEARRRELETQRVSLRGSDPERDAELRTQLRELLDQLADRRRQLDQLRRRGH